MKSFKTFLSESSRDGYFGIPRTPGEISMFDVVTDILQRNNIEFNSLPARAKNTSFITVDATDYEEALSIVDKKLVKFEHLGNNGRVIDKVVVRVAHNGRITKAVSFTAKNGEGVIRKVDK